MAKNSSRIRMFKPVADGAGSDTDPREVGHDCATIAYLLQELPAASAIRPQTIVCGHMPATYGNTVVPPRLYFPARSLQTREWTGAS
ncbi:hypothetical protein J6590_028790 [Homalodisca vitripennis]|nr:hypothetical protein J6590_028790 [Homalodisca vitripennis]